MSLSKGHGMFAAGCVALAAAAGMLAMGQPTKSNEPPKMDEPPAMPEGMTEEMQACYLAGQPGEMHAKLMEHAGTWTGTNTMWMAPDSPSTTTNVTFTMTPMMDGRYLKTEVRGEMPDMGPFQGMGITGFDNVSQQLVGTWIDSWSTGIMNGTGVMSDEDRTATWRFTYNCPVTKKPTTMREIWRYPDANTMNGEFYCIEPTSGKEYKCMQMELKRQSRGSNSRG